MVLVLAACGSATPAASRPGALSTSALERAHIPLPAGPTPSRVSKMVCSRHLQRELLPVLGVRPTQVTTPTWASHLYSCRYVYPDGSFGLSVKELSSWAQTKAYFAVLGRQLGDTGKLGDLGQGAFTTGDGSVVVRKDYKVLLVDISGLPASFGKPATPRADVAVTVADEILGCWDGD